MAEGLCRNGHDLAVVGRRADGRCRACAAERWRRYYAENREALAERRRRYRAKNYEAIAARERVRHALPLSMVSMWKLEAGCADCGRADVPEVLDCHHVDPTTKAFDVAAAVQKGRPLAAIADELEKCVVLCKSCHAYDHHYG